MAPAHRDRYNQLQSTELQRTQLIEELLEENERLKASLEKTTQRLERDSDTVELYQQRSKEAINKYDALQKLTESHAYVCVIIDGNCTNFCDQLIQNATVGGQDAAQLLRNAVVDYARGLGIDPDIEIVLYVFANVYELLKLYRDSKLTRDPSEVDRFINGFNKTYPLQNFVDAGNSKGCTEDKLCKMFELNACNVHCKHLILGGSSRNSYSRVLEKLVDDESARNMVTLLHGPPFATEIERVSHLFRIISFPRVFRDTLIERSIQKVPAQSRGAIVSAGCGADHNTDAAQSRSDNIVESLNLHPKRGQNGVTEEDENNHVSDKSRKHSIETSHHATILATRGQRPPGKVGLEKIVYPSEYFIDAPLNFIARNKYGERVDVPLTQPPSGLIHEIKRRKLCNDYCLGGRCQNHNCRHEHANDLDLVELHVLRDVARSFPCPAGLRCNDRECFQGHRCPFDPCGLVRNRACRYPSELHDVVTGIVNKEDLDKILDDSPNESIILGPANKTNGATTDYRLPPTGKKRSRDASPVYYRNITKKFDTAQPDRSIGGVAEKNDSLFVSVEPPEATTASEDTAAMNSKGASSIATLDPRLAGRRIKVEEYT